MGKNRKQASLTNVVQYDSNFNLSIGSSTSSSFNSSGSIIAASGFTGSLSGSVFGLGNTVSFSSSVSSDLVNLESKSASVDISITNINSVTASNIARLSNLESKSSSVDISVSSLNTFSASNANQSLNSKTGSYATTGSNSFYGTQVFSGSVYIANDLVVQGSSSIQYISASSVSIGTNIIQLNTANPSVRFAGLSIIDSGSVGGSGSFLYDSLQDEFIFVHRGNGTNITSSHFVLGPETYDSLGNETYLTSNIIPKGTGKEHLIDSCIFDNGTTTCIKNNLVGTGTITGTTIYGSTAVCSTVGKFTSCIDAGTGTFSGALQGDYLVVGTVAATSGGLRLGTQVAIRARNVANTANIPLIESTATDGVSVSNGALIITCTSRVGIGCTCPGYKIDVDGNAHFRADGATMLIESTQPTNSHTLKIVQCSTGGNGNNDQGLVVQINAGDGTSNIANFYDYNNGSPVSRVKIQKNGITCFSNTICVPLIFAPGTPIQVITGNATVSSGAAGTGYSMGTNETGNQTPLYNQGLNIAQTTFTPKSATSKILIMTNNVVMWERSNVSDHFYLWAANHTDGTILVKSGQYLNSFGPGAQNGGIINLNGAASSWGTSTKTIIFRIGTTGSSGAYYEWNPYYGAAGFNADTVGNFTYTIMEIAQ